MKKRISCILLVLCVLLCPDLKAQRNDPISVENRLTEAVRLYSASRFAEAKTILTSLLGAAPGNDAVLYYLGLCDMGLQDFEEAETFLSKAAELDPGNYWYQDRLAVLYGLIGQPDRAAAIFERMLERFPGRSDIYYSLLNVYVQQGRGDKVSEILQTLIDLTGDTPQLLAMMGDAKMTEYEDSTALHYYDLALSQEPDFPPALLGKAEVLRIRREYDGYFDLLDRYIASEAVPVPAKTEYLGNIFQHMDGRFYQNFKDRLDALAANCLQMHPSDSSALLCIGSYYYSSGRGDEAKQCLARNKTLYPDSYSATVLYVQLLSYLGDWQEMADECEAGLQRFPEEMGFIESRVMAFYNLKDYPAAIRENERIIALYPKDRDRVVSAYATIGDLSHEMGDSKRAYASYEKALKLNPDYAPVLNNYAYYLCLEGKNLKKALAMSKKTIDQEPDNSTYLDTYGWILFCRGKAADAKPVFKHAMIYGGKESYDCLEHYATVLDALGETDLGKYYHNLAAQKKTEGQ